MADKKKDKPRVLRSRGVMRDASRLERAITAVVLAIACVALAFTQLGFASIGAPGEGMAYAVVLLIPVALAALLLGTLFGTLIGLVAGLSLYIHAMAMPLDYYELSFVTPLTSIAMLGVSGFLLGFLFAFVLRHDPSQPKRVIYIAIVCVIVSVLYSVGFLINVIIAMIADMAANGVAGMTEEQIQTLVYTNVATMAIRMGDMSMQFWADAVLMFVFCVGGDIAARGVIGSSGNRGLRGVFASLLSVVALIAFMITAGASFIAISHGELIKASETMESEATYLVRQVSEANSRGEALSALLEAQGVNLQNLTDDSVSNLIRSVSMEALLDGYSKESDGTILVLTPAFTASESELTFDEGDFTVFLSDDGEFATGKRIKEIVDKDVVRAIKESVDSGKVSRTIIDHVDIKSLEDLENSDSAISSEIVYLYAQTAADYYTVVVMKPASVVFSERGLIMGWTTLSVFALLAAVFLAMFMLLNRLVVRRIDETNGVLGRITDGDLEAHVDVRDTREFKSLSDGINETVGALKGWIAEAETRMDAELATAKAIQESALPRTFPPYPDIQRFDVYASMKPAREVGGDFYDFFLIGDECNADEGKLGFVVADVSGKGVPAALFMMKAMTQIRDYLQSGMEVGEAVENANRKLCEGNEAGMFVTAWVGVLDYATGHVEYANAGHNPPLLWQADNGWRWLTDKSGLPLGLFDGLPYDSFNIDCGIGDEFLLYSDGVTEAMSEEGELFGEERLEDLLKEHYTLHPRRLVDAVRRSVALHAQGAEQSDDITILALEVGVPPELTATIIVPADVDELPHVNEFIHTELDRRLCPKRTQNQLDIAVEELFVNVAHYAYPDATPENPGMARVSYTYNAEPPSVRVDIADDGIPYNPLDKPDAVTPDDIMDVPIGGMGILMAKRSVDEMTYERVDDSNVVTILKKW